LAPTPSPVTIPTPSANQSGLININTANATELDKITGVGPAYAKNIIDYRTLNGPFQKIEDIINVKGIGPKTFENMKNEITV
jgi:competence protein ComEA